MNLFDQVTQATLRYPDAIAFLHGGRTIRYRAFHAQVCQVVRQLSGHGIQPGETVGITMAQTPLHVSVVLALARLGAISVPVHAQLPAGIRQRVAGKYGIRTLVATDPHPALPGVRIIQADDMGDAGVCRDTDFVDFMPGADTPFRISLTSGTTGDPKGDLLTQGQFLQRVERTLAGFGFDRETRLLPTDLNATMGLSLVVGALMAGATLVFPDSYLAPDRMATLHSQQVTHAVLSHWACRQILALLPEDGIAFPGLKALRLVGSATPADLLDALQRRFTPHVFDGYGLTETGPIALATPEVLRQHPGCSGKVLPWVQLDVVDENRRVLPPGQSGEIRLKIPLAAREYYRDPEASARKFRDGGFYTGDLGRISADGILFIEGRLDEMINLGGYKIHPGYVEETLARHPQVREAAVFPMPAASGGAALGAAIVPGSPPPDLEQLARDAREQLGFGAPAYFFLVQELPRNPNGKIIRSALAARFAAQSGPVSG